MLVTLPFLLLLLDYWPLNRVQSAECGVRNIQKLVMEKLPFFALTAASCVVTFIAQNAGHAVKSLDYVPLSYRFENAVTATARYLSKMAWPADLSVIYPIAPIAGGTVALAAAML